MSLVHRSFPSSLDGPPDCSVLLHTRIEIRRSIFPRGFDTCILCTDSFERNYNSLSGQGSMDHFLLRGNCNELEKELDPCGLCGGYRLGMFAG